MPDSQHLLRRAALAEKAAEGLAGFPEFQQRLLAQAGEWRRLAAAGQERLADEAAQLEQPCGGKTAQEVVASVATWAVLLSGAGAL